MKRSGKSVEGMGFVQIERRGAVPQKMIILQIMGILDQLNELASKQQPSKIVSNYILDIQ